MSDPNSPFTKVDGGLKVRVRVTPKSALDRLDGIHTEADGTVFLKAAVRAAPEGEKANAALIKLLSKAWRVPKTSLSVIGGATNRRKTLRIEGDSQALESTLKEWMERKNG